MSILQQAGNSMAMGGYGGHGRPGGMSQVSTLGVRSLREEYAKPSAKADIPRNLKIIEERYQNLPTMHEPVASAERHELPRFEHLFKGGELLPAGVFICALELKPSETLNGRPMQFDSDVLTLRDHLVMQYKPLVGKIRQLHAKEIDELPERLVLSFTRAWTSWEAAWLRNREVHAVDALQPLAKAILSLEPLLLSAEKERLLPWPRVQHQKAITLKCLEGFVHSLSELAGCVLPSLSRELDHDSRLFLLMDHVLSLRGDKSVISCLDGLSSAPAVSFPDHQGSRGQAPQSTANIGQDTGMTLDAYSFKLLGSSVGDAVASGKLKANSGNGQAGRAKMAQSLGSHSMDVSALSAKLMTVNGKESGLSSKAALHAAELLGAFEAVKDVLLMLKANLEHIDPALDKDEVFVQHFQRLERSFKKAKRLFLEPDNLA